MGSYAVYPGCIVFLHTQCSQDRFHGIHCSPQDKIVTLSQSDLTILDFRTGKAKYGARFGVYRVRTDSVVNWWLLEGAFV